MSNILTKLLFLMVLAGLLTWGVATMAQAPAVNTDVSDTAIQLQGQVIEDGREIPREAVRPF